MAKKLSKANIAILLAVVAAAAANQFYYMTEAQAKPLADAGMIEMNKSMANPAAADQFATRPTEAGITEAKKPEHAAAASANTAAAGVAGSTASPQPDKPKPSFAVVTGVALPTVKRGGGGNTYPFDTMAAPVPGPNGTSYASFFVAATEAKPSPAKSLASTVSSASKRYVAPDVREFVVRSIKATDAAQSQAWGVPVGTAGAAIFRLK